MEIKTQEVIKEMIKKGYTMTNEGKLINPKGEEVIGCINTHKYRKAGIRILDNISFSVPFHRFQGYLKFGDRIFESKMVLRHLDNDADNNSWDNIGIGTQRDNMMDIPLEKRRKMAMSPRKYDHDAIITDKKAGMTYKKIMSKYGISSKGTVSFIINKSMAN